MGASLYGGCMRRPRSGDLAELRCLTRHGATCHPPGLRQQRQDGCPTWRPVINSDPKATSGSVQFRRISTATCIRFGSSMAVYRTELFKKVRHNLSPAAQSQDFLWDRPTDHRTTREALPTYFLQPRVSQLALRDHHPVHRKRPIASLDKPIMNSEATTA
jgi:hypothetical protein